MEYKEKKILLINGWSISVQNATGITMRSIFRNWNIDNLYEISCSPSSVDSIYLNKKVYALPYKYYPIYYFLNMRIFKKANNISKEQQNKIAIDKGEKTFSNLLRRTIIAYTDAFPLFPPTDLLKKVKKFKPDYIYTLGGSILSLKLALYFSKKLNINIVVHFMDNWQDTLYTEFLATRPCHRIMKKKLEEVYSRMDIGITISEKMASEYTHRWGKKHIPIMNSVIKVEESPNIRNDNHKIIFTYAGGLHLERWRSLLVISQIIKAHNTTNEKEVKLKIYTSQKDKQLYSNLFDETIVNFCDYVPHDKVNLVYQSSDVLVHIESFDPQIGEFIKYSLSTKISEYMSSGKPILLYAPNDIAVTEYINENLAGLACSNNVELEDAIKRLSDSDELRYQLALNGINCAKKNHTYENTKNKLNIAFQEIDICH